MLDQTIFFRRHKLFDWTEIKDSVRTLVWNAISAKSWDFMMNGRGFITNGRDFHDEWSRFSWRTVEIFMMNGRDFYDERSKFSWWTVEIFMMNGRDFHDERSRFSWWTVEIFIMAGPELFYCFGLNPRTRGEHLVIQLLGFIHVLALSIY